MSRVGLDGLRDGKMVHASQRRLEPRFTVRLGGELLVQGERIACELRDLSRGGACVDAERALRRGQVVVLMRGALRVGGKIAWARGRRFGLQFEAPIRATELLVQMSEGRRPLAVLTPEPDRLS